MIISAIHKLESTRYLKSGLSLLMAVFLGLTSSATGQTSTTPQRPNSEPATIRSLKVVPLAGNQEMNDLADKVMAPLVVEVLDRNDQPVEGADVTFRFPVQGPSAAFPGQKTSQTFRTNADGQASAIGWMANSQVGTFKVQVTAARGNEFGFAMVTLTNVTKITGSTRVESKKWWSKKWVIIGIAAVAAGVVTGVVLATRGGSGKVVVATPGSPTLGAPQ